MKCTVHDNQVHGKEAEELRAGIEQALRLDSPSECRAFLEELLMTVDARDSLVFCERRKRKAKQ